MLSVSQKKYQAADLFRSDPYYKDNSYSWIARNVFLPIEYGKAISFIRDNKLRGLVTYAFLTEEEIKENRIDALKVFQRKKTLSNDNEYKTMSFY